MILIDINQVLIAALMQQINSLPGKKLDENLIRHMALNSIRSYVRQFKEKYGEIVICCDSKSYWRRGVFPFYKSNRKKDRDKSGHDWTLIFETLNKLRDELKTYFPYKVIDVDGAEADDIIAVLAARFAPHEEVLILSSDKDFVQLQKYPNVSQYSPILKRYVKTEDPSMYIKEHIIKGDRGDGIPNLLSADNVFALGERQKVINTKKLSEWLKMSPEDFCTTEVMLRNYRRNQMLVDLDFVPEQIKVGIVSAYEEAKPNPRIGLIDYFMKNNLKNLMSVVDEF